MDEVERVLVKTEEITQERLEKWARKLEKAHATPMLLIGAGADGDAGKLVICTLEEHELDTRWICRFLRNALQELGDLR